MTALLLLARLVLAAVFLVAGSAKLADVAGSRRALREFGVPVRLAAPVGVLLPLAEVGVAVALLPEASAWWGAAGALVLLVVFVVGIGYNLARGRQPDCHCFGQVHSAPVGWPTLVRNLVLAALAGWVVAVGRTSPGGNVGRVLAGVSVAGWALLVAVGLVVVLAAGLGWLVVNLVGQQGRLLLRIEALEEQLTGPRGAQAGPGSVDGRAAGLPVGSPAPSFAVSTLEGEPVTLEGLRGGDKPLVLLFTDPGCGPCTALLPDVGHWRQEYADTLSLAVIGRGTVEANRAKLAGTGVPTVLLQQDWEVATAYQAYGTPSAVLIGRDGTIRSPLAQGADQIRDLVAAAAPGRRLIPLHQVGGVNGHHHGGTGQVGPSAPAGLPVGAPAPLLRLPDLDGTPLDLADFRGRATIVLLWNPGCGFCRGMVDDLRAWEASRPPDGPALLIVSTGTPQDNREFGFDSTIVLDEGFATGRRFAASGTPSAVLIDPAGKIASPLAVGAPAVLALAGAGRVAAG